jgi:hypothetical protein
MPQKMTAFWDIASCRHTEVGRNVKDAYCHHHQGDDNLKALITSETSVRFYETTIPGGSHLHTRRHENLKPHKYTSDNGHC